MKIIATSRKIHKWLMLLIGLQLLIWSISGSYMVSMNIDFIHGDHLIATERAPIEPEQVGISVHQLRQRFPTAEQIRLSTVQQRAVYRFRDEQGVKRLDALTGELLANLDRTAAAQIAKASYTGQGQINTIELLTDAVPDEVSARILPAWRVAFDDLANSTVYISAYSGAITTKRHDFWRLFDLLFRLHIMDYSADEDSANKLLLVIAAISLIACLAGLVLTYVSFVIVRGRSIKPPSSPMARNKVMPWMRFLHRWLSLLLVGQLLIWLGTGLYFNLMDHRAASGNQLRQRMVEQTINYDTEKFVAISSILQGKHVTELALVERVGQAYYLLQTEPTASDSTKQQLIVAHTGAMAAIDEKFAANMATLSYQGQGKLLNVQHALPPIADLAGNTNPLWQVSFEDSLNTNVYLDGESGLVVAHVDDDKRLADLMFMLHFMDYGKTGHFNHWLVVLFALICLLFSVTGLYWLLHLIKHKQFKWR
jgi:uncharacterized iron-regulated membrane protein